MSIIRWIAAGDNHGHHVCKETEEALAVHIGRWKPTVRIMLGDCFDFGAWRRGASPEDAVRQSMGQEGLEFLEKKQEELQQAQQMGQQAQRVAEANRGALKRLPTVIDNSLSQ